MEATHSLEIQRQTSSAESKCGSTQQKPLTSWKADDRCCQQVAIKLNTKATHSLETRG